MSLSLLYSPLLYSAVLCNAVLYNARLYNKRSLWLIDDRHGHRLICDQPKAGYRGVTTGTFIHRNHLADYVEICLAPEPGLLMANGEDNAATFRVILALPFVCMRIERKVHQGSSR
jgi:hypothetical protein